MKCSIELWFRFLKFAFEHLTKWQSPLRIAPTDQLAREIYSGSFKNGKVKKNAFIASPNNKFGISVNRWCKAPHRLFADLAVAAAKKRKGNVQFKGVAIFPAEALQKIRVDETPPPTSRGDPTARNAFHANIPIPSDRQEDYYLLVAIEFIETVKPRFERHTGT